MARQSKEARGLPGLSNGARSEGIRRNCRGEAAGDTKPGREPAEAILDIWIKYLDRYQRLAYMGPISLTFWWERAC